MRFIDTYRISKPTTPIYSVIITVIVCILLLPFLTSAQSHNPNSQIKQIIDSTQKMYGSNDLLVNGQVYYQPNRMASGTPFLFSSKFEQGTIFTRGLAFDVAGLNYNIVDNELILLNIATNGTKLHIKLSNILIDSFLLNNYLFVNPKELNITSNYPFMLATNKGQLYFLIGYDKEFINRFSENDPYGKFSSTKKSLFIVTDNTLVRINSKKVLLKHFPSDRKEVSAFLKKHKIKILKASPIQLKHLMEFCNNQLANTDE